MRMNPFYNKISDDAKYYDFQKLELFPDLGVVSCY